LELSDTEFKAYDFEHPSILFKLEDKLKGLLGGPLLYNSYFQTFGLKGNEKVLDFGCGGGAGSKYLVSLLNNEGHLTCIDLSSYWIERARKRLKKYSNIECKSGDIRELDIPDSCFNVITVIHVIHDIIPEDRKDTLNTLSEKLKTGGLFFVREPVKKPHGMSPDEIMSLFTGAGLIEITHDETKSEYMGKYQKSG
jgi:ubiquinone/menaquinone biosynthesis C-methylase UbiE